MVSINDVLYEYIDPLVEQEINAICQNQTILPVTLHADGFTISEW